MYEKTIGRNTGIFYFMFQCSLIIGNAFVYFQFNGEKYITDGIRRVCCIVFSVVSLIGLATLNMLFCVK